MFLIISSIFLCLLHYSFAQDRQIQFDINCPNDGNNLYYYNSLEYQCQTCGGIKGIDKDICYKENISIYTFNSINLNTCGNNEVFTELDEDQYLLESPVCANTIFDFNDMNNGTYPSFKIADEDLSIRIDSEYLYVFSSSREYDYYYYSCLQGKFNRSCDFMANLYSLSLYSNNNIVARIINDLNDLLHKEGIL